MNIYLISQEVNNWYDTYDSAVVVAESPEQAQHIHPDYGLDWNGKRRDYGAWCDAEDVCVQFVGIAGPEWQKAGIVICSSFNAG